MLQVSVDVAWSPDCIDQRCYDYVGLSKSSDFLFVMAYAEQSQIFGKCIAGANSDYVKTSNGMCIDNMYLIARNPFLTVVPTKLTVTKYFVK